MPRILTATGALGSKAEVTEGAWRGGFGLRGETCQEESRGILGKILLITKIFSAKSLKKLKNIFKLLSKTLEKNYFYI